MFYISTKTFRKTKFIILCESICIVKCHFYDWKHIFLKSQHIFKQYVYSLVRNCRCSRQCNNNISFNINFEEEWHIKHTVLYSKLLGNCSYFQIYFYSIALGKYFNSEKRIQSSFMKSRNFYHKMIFFVCLINGPCNAWKLHSFYWYKAINLRVFLFFFLFCFLSWFTECTFHLNVRIVFPV